MLFSFFDMFLVPSEDLDWSLFLRLPSEVSDLPFDWRNLPLLKALDYNGWRINIDLFPPAGPPSG